MVRVFGSYKCCMVPGCPNTTATAPGKLFALADRGQLNWARKLKRKLDEEYVCEDHFQLEASVVEDRAMKDPKERDTEMPQLSEPESPWTAEEDDWCPGERRMPALKRVYPPHAEKRHLAPRANDEALEAALSLCLLSQQEVPPMAQPQPPLKEDKGVQCKPQKCSKSVQCNLEKRQRLENEESDSCTDHDTSLE